MFRAQSLYRAEITREIGERKKGNRISRVPAQAGVTLSCLQEFIEGLAVNLYEKSWKINI